jgi:hypothetical protein
MFSEDMDPDTSKSPGFALPNSSAEGGVSASMPPLRAAEGTNEVMMPQVEVMPSGAASLPPATPPPAAVAMSTPMQTPMMSPADPAVASTASVADDTNSDDLDLEWVNKAKAIVEQTKNDPHIESRELGKVKADYLRIRYNKNIKIAEEQSR